MFNFKHVSELRREVKSRELEIKSLQLDCLIVERDIKLISLGVYCER